MLYYSSAVYVSYSVQGETGALTHNRGNKTCRLVLPLRHTVGLRSALSGFLWVTWFH